ncbi:Ribosomal large subunit pseudouridine synthase B [Polystyrenella longa]|uniref:Pseudouridine synthase n=1 Tax=Polystyrenella longa TaxID=2528007 RepID=A0A518CMG8_9PLAN|nr:pseudouridine synthase [Polystyrenella longa]QDU80422.1 Ribosomal large subunit pseudouridine synthase B [Polystyrenella longa]
MSSPDGEKKIRLQKFLAAAGVGSRRRCEELILKGLVCVDGEVINHAGAMVDPDHQKIEVEGDYLKKEPKRYYLLHKPAGYLCTSKDPAGRPLAIDLIDREHYRLFTVGRLDENSAGLLLVTNDGELANRLAHPRYEIARTYEVQVAGRPTPETLGSIRNGLWFSDGFFKVARVKQLNRRGNSTFLQVELHEGKNREVRRLFARVGHKVMHLQRVRFGPLNLGRLGLGKYRSLTKTEFDALMALLEKPVEGPEKKTASGAHRSAAKRKGRKTAKKRSSTSRTPRQSTRGASRSEEAPRGTKKKRGSVKSGGKRGAVKAGRKKAAFKSKPVNRKVKSKGKPPKGKPAAGKPKRNKRN